MHRLIAGFIAFLTLTATMLIVPVYAAPTPEAEPVAASVDEVEMGSLDEPAPAAEVQTGTTDSVPGVADTTPALTVVETDTRFSLVGVTWTHDPAITDTVVQIRTQDEDGVWGEWTAVAVEDAEQDPDAVSGGELRGGTEPLWTGPSTGVEAELVTRSGARPSDVRLDLVDPGESPADGALESPEITDTADAASAMPPVYSRAQWGADESIRTWDPEYAPTIKAAVVHHTAGANGYAASDVPAILRGIYTYHAVTRGWGDIGYNVLVDRFGRLWEGRAGGLASTVIGAHTGGFNTSTFGVSMLGNYDQVAPTASMLSAVADIVAWKFALYGVDPRGTATLTGGGGTSRWPAGTTVYMPTIMGHRDLGNTTCPGQYGYARMNDLRTMVEGRAGDFGTRTLGNVEVLSITAQTVSVRGWTIDPNEPTSPATVVLTVDGRPEADFVADIVRRDVGAAYPEAGSAHGFSGTATIPEGEHTVCVTLQPLSTETLPATTCGSLEAVHPDRLAEPIGNVDSVAVDGRRILARGWTIDQDAQTAALDVHVYVNGGWGGSYRADRSRLDVARAYPDAGSQHGYDIALNPPGPGTYEVCVFAINQNAGVRNPQLGCRTVVSPRANWAPVGSLDSAAVAGRTVTLSGWALDEDVPTQALEVHLYLDGRYQGAVTAARGRPDVGRAYPAAGSYHGYALGIDVPAGRHQVCTYAINAGAGSLHPRLGCATVTVAAAAWNPIGSLDTVTAVGSTVTYRGWALDPDAWRDPDRVLVYVNGGYVGAVSASRSRPDVGRAYPQAGSLHGYEGSFALPRGSHQVCVSALNVGQGSANTRLGCRTVTVP